MPRRSPKPAEKKATRPQATPGSPLLAGEVGTFWRRAPAEVVLCYANSYRVAASSLGFQVIYRDLNQRDDLACHRAVYEPPPGRGPLPPIRSLEYGKRLDEYDAILVSLAYELDLANLALMLQACGLSPLASERPESAPPLIVGGPVTTSNVLPLGVFADVVVMGEADQVVTQLADILAERPSRAELRRWAAEVPGLWVPLLQGDAVPAQRSVGPECLPALGQFRSPNAEFSDMMLLEASRGCPRYCTFCVVRAPLAPMREPELDRVVAALDRPEFAASPRVGLVGAAVSDWGPIKGAMRAIIERGKTFGISSLRADRLDEDDEFADLLYQGGYRTMTVASDAPSQRLRGKLKKGIRERHLWGAALQARRVGMNGFKMYVIIGLPGEEAADVDELIDFSRRLSTQVRTATTLSPFVPKLHTPLAAAEFADPEQTQATLRRIQAALAERVDVRFDAPKWAWVEYRLSQGGLATGLAAIEAARNGGGSTAWRRALAALDARDPKEERAALAAANKHGLWPATGER